MADNRKQQKCERILLSSHLRAALIIRPNSRKWLAWHRSLLSRGWEMPASTPKECVCIHFAPATHITNAPRLSVSGRLKNPTLATDVFCEEKCCPGTEKVVNLLSFAQPNSPHPLWWSMLEEAWPGSLRNIAGHFWQAKALRDIKTLTSGQPRLFALLMAV